MLAGHTADVAVSWEKPMGKKPTLRISKYANKFHS